MPQYGVLVYLPTPADPAELTTDYLESLERYPAQVQEAGGKVLGGSYFVEHRGFAFQPITTTTVIRGDAVRGGPMVESELAPAAFYVLAAPDMEVAVRLAQLHPATRDGAVEVRPLFVPPTSRGAKA